MPPIVRVEISHDGKDVYVIALQQNVNISYGLLNRNQIKRVGNVTLSYGLNNSVRRIGGFSVVYDWGGHVQRIAGKDDRVEVVVHTRAQKHEYENHDARKHRRS